jgi:hypothetical protein
MAYRVFVAVLGAVLLISHDSLRKIAVIDVPGPKGQRFDYLTIDAEDRYLLSGHLGPGILYVDKNPKNDKGVTFALFACAIVVSLERYKYNATAKDRKVSG